MRCSPLKTPFGARLELETDAPLSSREQAELRGLLATHGLLVVQGDEISADRHIELLSALGRVEPDTTGRAMRMEVTNQHDRSTAPQGELVFHYDYAYDPEPIPAISLYAQDVAEGATPTLFASSATVLSRLPRAMVERLRSHEASHACFLFRPDDPNERSQEPDPILPRGAPGWGPAHYWAHHPVVWKNSLGVETLFVCLQHTDRIIGMPRSESDEILGSLYAALYATEEIYEHAWRPHDLVIWDNLTVQHARPKPNDRPRTLRRFHVSNTDLTEDYLRVGREYGFV
jgi:taurine dioxygenase